ncbi:hypothetical protein KP509_25G047300 [Ceratopteris richardii]|uniref:Uncharacterized protein n=1 Tax=Ceratopteris richardii TaxID=49495 RepID=A0A8T2RPT9_CERRI|nr:hypothetical protein KP509_25G047300 [Ceratopteris richardii]
MGACSSKPKTTELESQQPPKKADEVVGSEDQPVERSFQLPLDDSTAKAEVREHGIVARAEVADEEKSNALVNDEVRNSADHGTEASHDALEAKETIKGGEKDAKVGEHETSEALKEGLKGTPNDVGGKEASVSGTCLASELQSVEEANKGNSERSGDNASEDSPKKNRSNNIASHIGDEDVFEHASPGAEGEAVGHTQAPLELDNLSAVKVAVPEETHPANVDEIHPPQSEAEAPEVVKNAGNSERASDDLQVITRAEADSPSRNSVVHSDVVENGDHVDSLKVAMMKISEDFDAKLSSELNEVKKVEDVESAQPRNEDPKMNAAADAHHCESHEGHTQAEVPISHVDSNGSGGVAFKDALDP